MRSEHAAFRGELALVIAACWRKLGPRGLVFQRRRPKWQVCVETRKQSHADARHGGEHILKRTHRPPKKLHLSFCTHSHPEMNTHNQSLCWEGWVMHTVCMCARVCVVVWVGVYWTFAGFPGENNISHLVPADDSWQLHVSASLHV